jgi:hypothetical protein
MKVHILVFIFFLITTISYGQITFEKGYFIDNNNQRVECLIKDYEWKSNPKNFEYELNENDKPKTGDLSTVKEFGILGSSKYIRVDTRIDRSSMDVSDLSTSREPIWSQEQLYLKVLIEGFASLYYYEDGNFWRFFYSVNNSPVQQLIFKEYLISTSDNNYATNREYYQQLWSNIRGKNTSLDDIKLVDYNMSDLKRYFKKYNDSTGNPFIEYEHKRVGFPINLKITSGINYSSLSINNVSSSRSADFKSKAALRIGLEAEFILPFNKNRWGIFFEPTYRTYSATQQSSNSSVNINAIEFPLGLRRYFFFKDKCKVFIDGLYVVDCGINFNSNFAVNPFYFETPYKITGIGSSFAVGGGVDYSGISMEIRYYTHADVLGNYVYWTSDYSRLSFIIGYRLFGLKHGKH